MDGSSDCRCLVFRCYGDRVLKEGSKVVQSMRKEMWGCYIRCEVGFSPCIPIDARCGGSGGVVPGGCYAGPDRVVVPGLQRVSKPICSESQWLRRSFLRGQGRFSIHSATGFGFMRHLIDYDSSYSDVSVRSSRIKPASTTKVFIVLPPPSGRGAEGPMLPNAKPMLTPSTAGPAARSAS